MLLNKAISIRTLKTAIEGRDLAVQNNLCNRTENID